jgi:phage gp36-like protein
MPYCTPEDVRGALGPLVLDKSRTAQELTDGELANAIASSQTIVDGYTGTSYSDGSVPGLVKTLTQDIAAYYATLTYRRGKALTADDPVTLRYAAAITMLGDIVSGVITLDPDDGSDDGDDSPSDISIQNTQFGPLFGPSDFALDEWQPAFGGLATIPNTGLQTPPPVPVSGTAIPNPFPRSAFVTITGGNVTEIDLNNTAVPGWTSGTQVVPFGTSIRLFYTIAPTWSWVTF